MIIRNCNNYFLIKVLKRELENFNFFDINDIKNFFKSILIDLKKKYNLCGLLDADVYVNNSYGMIIELQKIESYSYEIDVRIKLHIGNVFLVEIDSNSILDYDDVYYYNGKFYGNYIETSDNEIFYKNTEDIINKGIKIC